MQSLTTLPFYTLLCRNWCWFIIIVPHFKLCVYLVLCKDYMLPKCRPSVFQNKYLVWGTSTDQHSHKSAKTCKPDTKHPIALPCRQHVSWHSFTMPCTTVCLCRSLQDFPPFPEAWEKVFGVQLLLWSYSSCSHYSRFYERADCMAFPTGGSLRPHCNTRQSQMPCQPARGG